jgi:hypothetical protein
MDIRYPRVTGEVLGSYRNRMLPERKRMQLQARVLRDRLPVKRYDLSGMIRTRACIAKRYLQIDLS